MSQRYSPETVDDARLTSVRGVGPLTRRRLVDALGSASAVLRAPAARLARVEGVGPKLAGAIENAPDAAQARAMLDEAAALGIIATRHDEPQYPPRLREVYDAPALLYRRGEVLDVDERAVAIVGTRRATRYGLRQAEHLAAGLAKAGVTVVSGLARGIDAAAHRAAIAAGGRTLAVLAGGLMRIYPPEHGTLADEVARHGALLAESPPHMPPMSGSFPQRNRIISGASLGVVVVEAAERSGALITARHAAEQGRDAFALPGPIDSAASLGCHRLIQEGAKLVVTVDDILEELEPLGALRRRDDRAAAPLVATEPAPPARELSETERLVWDAIGDRPTAIDSVVDTTGLPVARVLATLSVMEAEGVFRRVSGALVQRS